MSSGGERRRESAGSEEEEEEEWLTVSVQLGDKLVSVQKRNPAYSFQDPCMFDEGYSIAGFTGFLVWDSCWVVLRQLCDGNQLSAVCRGQRVLELGSGTGLAGIGAAALGSHVLLTDLVPVTAHSLTPNIATNANDAAVGPPSKATVKLPEGVGAIWSEPRASTSGGGQPWAGSLAIGRGTAASMSLDWEETVDSQIESGGNDPRTADVILAVDTVWLKDLVQPFMSTVTQLLAANERMVCYMAFAERGRPDSKTFATEQDVQQEVAANGLAMARIHRQVYTKPEDSNESYTILLFRIAWPPPV